MRYLVRYFDNEQIINDLYTDDEGEAYKREMELRKVHGREKVWVVDALMELLAG